MGNYLWKYTVLQILRCLMSSIDRNIVELLAGCWGLIIHGISGHVCKKNHCRSPFTISMTMTIWLSGKEPSFKMEPGKILKKLSRHYTSLISSIVPASEDQLEHNWTLDDTAADFLIGKPTSPYNVDIKCNSLSKFLWRHHQHQKQCWMANKLSLYLSATVPSESCSKQSS